MTDTIDSLRKEIRDTLAKIKRVYLVQYEQSRQNYPDKLATIDRMEQATVQNLDDIMLNIIKDEFGIPEMIEFLCTLRRMYGPQLGSTSEGSMLQ